MGKMLVPNDGVRGIDIETERGVTKYDANKSGVIEVTNPIHRRSLKASGFTEAGVAIGVVNTTDECVCGAVKFEYQSVCSDCYVAGKSGNDGSDKSDSSAGQ